MSSSKVAPLPEVTTRNDADLPAPAGWSKGIDGRTGKTFYVNESTGKTTWKRPKDNKTTPEKAKIASRSTIGAVEDVAPTKEDNAIANFEARRGIVSEHEFGGKGGEDGDGDGGRGCPLKAKHRFGKKFFKRAEHHHYDTEKEAHEYKHTSDDVMISYSRTNKDFCQALVKFLRLNGIDPWIDWEDIPPAVDWWESIKSGITSAYAVIVNMTPAYLTSPICHKEIDEAMKQNKMMVPIVHIDVDYHDVRSDLAILNWIFIRRGLDDFHDGFKKVLSALHHDWEYIQMHSKLNKVAVLWQNVVEKNGGDMKSSMSQDLALLPHELEEAQQFLAEGAGKTFPPSDVTYKYVNFSRDVQKCRHGDLVKFLYRWCAALAVLLVASVIANIVQAS